MAPIQLKTKTMNEERETTCSVFIATGRQNSTESIWLIFCLGGGNTGRQNSKKQTYVQSDEVMIITFNNKGCLSLAI